MHYEIEYDFQFLPDGSRRLVRIRWRKDGESAWNEISY